MMIPSFLLLVPQYFQFHKLNLTNNLFVLMVIYAVQAIPLPVYMLTGFIKNINDSFIEAAVIDGANEFYVFSRVVLPFVRPILFFLCLGNIMGTWNEFVVALTFINDEKLYTVPIGLSYLVNQMSYRVEYGSLFAALVIAMIPILVLYAIFQKYIIHGMESSDGLKG
jgi:N-acetylglucosamine transport system permease protein